MFRNRATLSMAHSIIPTQSPSSLPRQRTERLPPATRPHSPSGAFSPASSEVSSSDGAMAMFASVRAFFFFFAPAARARSIALTRREHAGNRGCRKPRKPTKNQVGTHQSMMKMKMRVWLLWIPRRVRRVRNGFMVIERWGGPSGWRRGVMENVGGRDVAGLW